MNTEKFLTKIKVVALLAAFSLTMSIHASWETLTIVRKTPPALLEKLHVSNVNEEEILNTVFSCILQYSINYLEDLAQKNSSSPTISKYAAKFSRRFLQARYAHEFPRNLVKKKEAVKGLQDQDQEENPDSQSTPSNPNKGMGILNDLAHLVLRANSHDWAYNHNFNVGTPAESIHKSLQYYLDVVPPACDIERLAGLSVATAFIEGLDSKCWEEVFNNLLHMNIKVAYAVLSNHFNMGDALATLLAKGITLGVLNLLCNNNDRYKGVNAQHEFVKGLVVNGFVAGVNWSIMDVGRNEVIRPSLKWIKTKFSSQPIDTE